MSDRKVLITDIAWDTDGEEADLPEQVEMTIPEDVDPDDQYDYVENKLSDDYSYTVENYSINEIK